MTISSVPRLSELLSPADWELVQSRSLRRKYRDGEIIHEHGDREQTIGIVLSGRIKLINPRKDGAEVFSGLIHTGQNFGDAAMLHGEARQHRAIAIGETVIAHLAREEFDGLLASAAIARAFYTIATFRLSVSLALLDDMRTLVPEVRLGRLLYRMHVAADNAERLEFLQEDFAGMLGISTVTLAKALRKMSRLGFVETGYRHIRISDAPGLSAWLEEHVGE